MSWVGLMWSVQPRLRAVFTSSIYFEFQLFSLQEGIQPMWEDPVNKGGGRWVLNVDKRQRLYELSNMWLETVILSLCLIFRYFVGSIKQTKRPSALLQENLYQLAPERQNRSTWYMPWSSVCLSVRPSQVAFLLKRPNIGTCRQRRTIAQ